MKKPTLEEVKKHFENAEKIKDHSGDVGFPEPNKFIFTKLGSGIVQNVDKENWLVLWEDQEGFAKILTTKEKTFTITAEQLRQLTDPKLKEWFPEVFEVKLENNTWYVCHHYRSRYLINLTLTDESDTHNKGFGFDGHGNWNNNLSFLKAHDYRFEEATEQEVFEALKNESDKIGYKEGNYDCLTSFGNVLAIDSYFLDKDSMGNFELWKGKNCDANCIFKNGKWAKIIPTCTRAEAEKLLNKKIID